MKTSFVVVAFALFAVAFAADIKLTDEQKAKAKEHATVCIEREGITKEQAQALRQGNFDNVDGKVKCFANCFLEQAGFLVDGQVQESVIGEKLGEIVGADAIKAVQAKCNGLKGADKCDTAFQLYQCYYKEKAAF